MVYLIGSIVFTSYLTLSFKMLERLGISNLQAIVFNYITCVITGSIVAGNFPIGPVVFNQQWFGWSCIMGFTFVTLFNLVAYTTQKMGVAVASVANKLSLVIPFLFSLYLYNEQSTLLKVSGIIIAILAVLFTCWPHSHHKTSASKNISTAMLVLLPSVLFLGSGLLDTMIKYVEQMYLDASNNNAYLITTFAVAALTGTIILSARLIMRREKFDNRSIIAGICIGVPNYFSIWCFLQVLKQYAGNSSAIIPINNMGIVLFSAVVAYILFKERLSAINWIGIFLSISAISLIAYG
jgi:drug/metabolite transporter (DMT)-like permease